jgi:hypothetical protein
VLVRGLAVLVVAIAATAITYSYLPAPKPTLSLIPSNVSFAMPGLTSKGLQNCQAIWTDVGGLSARGFTTYIPPSQLDPFLRSARRLALAEIHPDHLVIVPFGRFLEACRSLESGHMWGPGSVRHS